ncbi:hypothetical protein [Romboutsia sp.]|nr:hypothetical protein [Romboutsia sp.]HSQ87622.1 hypothetical protein [Romboutsia sp.]
MNIMDIVESEKIKIRIEVDEKIDVITLKYWYYDLNIALMISLFK